MAENTNLITKVGPAPCWKNQFKIGKDAESATFLPECETWTLDSGANVSSWHGHGTPYTSAMVTSLSPKITVSHVRVKGNTASDFLMTKLLKTGVDAEAYVEQHWTDGRVDVMPNAVIVIKNPGSGASGDMNKVEFEIWVNGVYNQTEDETEATE